MRGPRAAVPPRRGEECRYQEGAHKAPGRRGAPGVPGTTRGGHPIAPTKPLSAGPHAGVPAWPPGRAEAGCGIRPSGGGSGPRGRRRRTADPTGRLPPGIWCQAWPAAIHPQTPSVPGAQRPPGFGRSDDGPSGGEPGGGASPPQTIFHRGWCRTRGHARHQPRGGDRSGREGSPPSHRRRTTRYTTRRRGRRGDCECRRMVAHQHTRSRSGERHCTSPLHIPSDLSWGVIWCKTVPCPKRN